MQAEEQSLPRRTAERPAGDGLPGGRLVLAVQLLLGLGLALGVIWLFWAPVLPHERERTSATPRATPAGGGVAPAPGTPAVAPSPAPAAAASPAPPAQPERRHTIQPGDTLLSIAQRYDTTVDAIRAANPGLSETALRVGVEIVIPPGR